MHLVASALLMPETLLNHHAESQKEGESGMRWQRPGLFVAGATPANTCQRVTVELDYYFVHGPLHAALHTPAKRVDSSQDASKRGQIPRLHVCMCDRRQAHVDVTTFIYAQPAEMSECQSLAACIKHCA